MSEQNNATLEAILARLEAAEKRAELAESNLRAHKPAVALPQQSDWIPGVHYYGFECQVKEKNREEKSVFMPFRVSRPTLIFVAGDCWDDGKRNHIVGPSVVACFSGLECVHAAKHFKGVPWDCSTITASSGVATSKRDFHPGCWKGQTQAGITLAMIENHVMTLDADSSESDPFNLDCLIIDVEFEYSRKGREDILDGVTFESPVKVEFSEWLKHAETSFAAWFESLDDRSTKSASRQSSARRHVSGNRR